MPKSSPAKGRSVKKQTNKKISSKKHTNIYLSISKNKLSGGLSKRVAVKQSSPAATKRARTHKAKLSKPATSRPLARLGKNVAPVRVSAPKVSPLRSTSVRQYETAMKLLYSHEYDKAKAAFERIISTLADDKEVLERAKIHLKLCEQKIARKPPAPRTLDEHYDLAVALMNEGKYDEAVDHFGRALKSNPKCDYVIYALAAMNSRTGNVEAALNNLQTAITLRPENRFLAQRDADFEPLKQDARFISMVFPERLTPAIR